MKTGEKQLLLIGGRMGLNKNEKNIIKREIMVFLFIRQKKMPNVAQKL